MKETILNVLKKMRTDYGNNENIIFAQDSDLDVVADELFVAINYSQCCTELCDEESSAYNLQNESRLCDWCHKEFK